ncbi:FAD-dependent oxidoreductase [Costertonia aggregata]|uniref:FAD-dependent oxidoreductase n=1 Tax=Costertonia aggregata TaxID=343403 RepID=A0A7H9ATW2_9FLAO|nr:FAD-dependent oxidoreductase [Costertonia aggregata]QLG46923.1 FAD-dependent oxidoreductase [Costertonia aggregata]
MKKSDIKIHIVGAGVSGLIAAQILEKKGYTPTILEKTDWVGGRVKTDIVNGYQLDHGFQVLLDAYPMAQKYLDYASLDLQEFLPGAVVYKNGKPRIIGDALRDISLLWPTLFSGIGTFSDKLKVFKLNTALKKKSIASIFDTKATTTLALLKSRGFSETFITDFFKPFFSGIFLEPDLATSSRMFEFVYKMFGEGLAVLPKSGIAAIPEQLKEKLSSTRIQFNTNVDTVLEGEIHLENGSTIKSDYTLLSTPDIALSQNKGKTPVKWKSCDTLYFTVPKRSVQKPLIGLIAKNDALVNNIFFHTSLEMGTKGKEELLSVTVVKSHTLSSEKLIDTVQRELRDECKIANTKFLKQYRIPRALPDLNNIAYTLSAEEAQIGPKLFAIGDYMLNGSLNAAMHSAEVATHALTTKIENDM